ncbi:hypothetical protein [Pseudorhodoferax sp. Leaf274]|uniref:hypothetical protein n=1 Tax=Pseudorhodoferax sp. Leaf274 TaxID=1736318 RepID=UPI00070285BA|nr:hypothetical protein [Pseudorhodoferax sp. Leaf274]KQP35248.1 hypothetical protein ASF44_17955 [Pseudorhodoferax sp. Leaf274]
MPPPSASSTPELQRDLLVFQGLRMRVHRIGLAHWQAGARLRSWGVAALHRAGDQWLAPCGADEALWLGFWQDEEDGPGAEVQLHDHAHGRSAGIVLPPDFQLTALRGADGTAHAIALPAPRYELRLSAGGVRCLLALQLQAPADWARTAGRAAPPALAGPPPLPPRYA